MISNQILQSTVDGLKSITNIDLCVMDTDGKQLASTFAETENYEEAVRTFTGLALDSQALQDCHLFKVYDDQHLEYSCRCRPCIRHCHGCRHLLHRRRAGSAARRSPCLPTWGGLA